jgi:hypothetical protein
VAVGSGIGVGVGLSGGAVGSAGVN